MGKFKKILHWGWFVEAENTIVHEKNSAHFDYPPPPSFLSQFTTSEPEVE